MAFPCGYLFPLLLQGEIKDCLCAHRLVGHQSNCNKVFYAFLHSWYIRRQYDLSVGHHQFSNALIPNINFWHAVEVHDFVWIYGKSVAQVYFSMLLS